MVFKQLMAGVALAVLAVSPALADDMTVAKDQSKVVKLAAAASTIVVGNPSIADVAMQDGNTAFVTGKAFGTTNVIAMDAQGRQIASFRIVVNASAERAVTLVRGAQVVTLSCAPRCEMVSSVGDPGTSAGASSGGAPAPVPAPAAPAASGPLQ